MRGLLGAEQVEVVLDEEEKKGEGLGRGSAGGGGVRVRGWGGWGGDTVSRLTKKIGIAFAGKME